MVISVRGFIHIYQSGEIFRTPDDTSDVVALTGIVPQDSVVGPLLSMTHTTYVEDLIETFFVRDYTHSEMLRCVERDPT